MKYCFDASVLIDIWKDYPIKIFKPLYPKIAEVGESIIIIKPMFDEVKDEDLFEWLEKKFTSHSPIVSIDNKTQETQLNLESKYETDNTKKGASSKDVALIAFAKLNKHTIVSHEAYQSQRPKEKSKYKIPLICKLEDIKCINFVEFLKAKKIKI